MGNVVNDEFTACLALKSCFPGWNRCVHFLYCAFPLSLPPCFHPCLHPSLPSFHWFERQNEIDLNPLEHSPKAQTTWGWSSPKVGAWNSIRVFHLFGRCPSTWFTFHSPPRHISKKHSSWDSNSFSDHVSVSCGSLTCGATMPVPCVLLLAESHRPQGYRFTV